MEEIKKRTEVINGFLAGECNAMYVQTTAESVSLQIRKILELIALASLAANQSEYAKHRRHFYKDWNAKRILETLKKVNPKFYPTPNRQVVDQESDKVVSLEEITSGFLTENEFITLFNNCNEILHADNPFSRTQNPQAFLASVPAWMEQIRILLNHHTIQLIDEDKQLWVMMKAKSDGKAHVYEFERIPAD
ncbi:hypothetical protein F4212_01875 [Candidatus Poribacteria bacterium]|nr:hypothetical protein [Gammaproteobacteria bacterium]MYF97873.1 hypothetical protein [Candidatus Poribacteria bacterium]